MWTKTKIQEALQRSSISLNEYNNFDVYMSIPLLRQRTHKLWISADIFETLDCYEKIMLCRTKIRPRQYFLGEFHKGKLMREYSLPKKDEVHWILLGICLLHGVGLRAFWNGELLNLHPLLPKALEKHFLLYTTPLFTDQKRYIYSVPKTNQEYVEAFLKYYNYEIIRKDTNLNGS